MLTKLLPHIYFRISNSAQLLPHIWPRSTPAQLLPQFYFQYYQSRRDLHYIPILNGNATAIRHQLSLSSSPFSQSLYKVFVSYLTSRSVVKYLPIHRTHLMASDTTMAFLPRGNDALNINPPVGVDLALTDHGSDWLWAVTAVHIISFVSFPFFPRHHSP